MHAATAVRCAVQVIAGSYDTTAGVVTFSVDRAQFMGVNTTQLLLFGSRSYDFIATADHQLTFHASKEEKNILDHFRNTHAR